jgi:hypothetical protein
MAENLGAAGHSGEPEIGGVGKQRRHQRHALFRRRSRAQMSGFKKTDPLRAPVVEDVGDGKPQLVFSPLRREGLKRQEKIIRKSSKARNARLPSTQTSPDRKRSRSVIMTATS